MTWCGKTPAVRKPSYHTGPVSRNRVKLRLIKDCLPLPPPTFAFGKWPQHPCSRSRQKAGSYSQRIHPPHPHIPSTSDLDPLLHPHRPRLIRLLYSYNSLPVGSILPPSDLSVMFPLERLLQGKACPARAYFVRGMSIECYLPHLSTPFSLPRNALASSCHPKTGSCLLQTPAGFLGGGVGRHRVGSLALGFPTGAPTISPLRGFLPHQT